MGALAPRGLDPPSRTEEKDMIMRTDSSRMPERQAQGVHDRIVATKSIEKGLIIVHTGARTGRSTAAFGMAVRMIGHGRMEAARHKS
jgi:ATP:corrinoid adenosyltransferase